MTFVLYIDVKPLYICPPLSLSLSKKKIKNYKTS
jgi:hypothetical protein